MTKNCLLVQPGLVDYPSGLLLQQAARTLVADGHHAGVLILLEHPPVITIGRAGGDDNLLLAPDRLAAAGITVVASDRGGNITGHNPGQLVGYPVLDLRHWRQDVHWYADRLEEVIIRTLATFGLKAGRKAKYTGVWLDDEKIAAIGLTVRQWITGHGFALNIDNDLGIFDGIVPCGIREFGVTSLSRSGVAADRPAVIAALTAAFAEVFDCTFTTGSL
jgi:lipoyl(octanoyl) transferase